MFFIRLRRQPWTTRAIKTRTCRPAPRLRYHEIPLPAERKLCSFARSLSPSLSRPLSPSLPLSRSLLVDSRSHVHTYVHTCSKDRLREIRETRNKGPRRHVQDRVWETLNKLEAQQAEDACLKVLEENRIDRAHIIEKRLEEHQAALTKLQAWPISLGRVMSGADSEYDSGDELPMLVVSDDESDEEPENGDDVPENGMMDAQRGLTNLIMRLKVTSRPRPAAPLPLSLSPRSDELPLSDSLSLSPVLSRSSLSGP